MHIFVYLKRDSPYRMCLYIFYNLRYNFLKPAPFGLEKQPTGFIHQTAVFFRPFTITSILNNNLQLVCN